MGIYLNPENDGFWESIRSEIYVDKTGLIAVTNKYINTELYLCQQAQEVWKVYGIENACGLLQLWL